MKRAIVHSASDREQLKKSKNKHSDFDPDFKFDLGSGDAFANIDVNGFETAMGHAERRGAAEIPGRTSLDSKIQAARIKRKHAKKPTRVDEKKLGDAIREKKVNKIGDAKKGDGSDVEEDQTVDDGSDDDDKEMSFQDFKLNRALLKAINELNWVQPSAIQKQSIPVALRGGDITACATTGSGKTGAFMIQ